MREIDYGQSLSPVTRDAVRGWGRGGEERMKTEESISDAAGVAAGTIVTQWSSLPRSLGQPCNFRPLLFSSLFQRPPNPYRAPPLFVLVRIYTTLSISACISISFFLSSLRVSLFSFRLLHILSLYLPLQYFHLYFPRMSKRNLQNSVIFIEYSVEICGFA